MGWSYKIYRKFSEKLLYYILYQNQMTFTIHMFNFSGKALKFDPGFKGTNLSVKNMNQAIYFGLYSYDGG